MRREDFKGFKTTKMVFGKILNRKLTIKKMELCSDLMKFKIKFTTKKKLIKNS